MKCCSSGSGLSLTWFAYAIRDDTQRIKKKNCCNTRLNLPSCVQLPWVYLHSKNSLTCQQRMFSAHCILSNSALRVAFRIQSSTQSVTFFSFSLTIVRFDSIRIVGFVQNFEHSIGGKCSKLNIDAHIVMPGVTFSTWCRSQLPNTPKFKTHCVSVVNFLSWKRLHTYLSSISVSVSLRLSCNVLYARMSWCRFSKTPQMHYTTLNASQR